MKVPKARKLKSGTWFIQLRLNGQSISVTAPSEKECVRMAQLRKAEYQAGVKQEKLINAKKAPTLSEAVDAYIGKRDAVLSPSSIRGYETIKRTRFQSLMNRPINKISANEWQIACNEEAKLVSPKTVKCAWGFIASVLRDATGEDAPKVRLPQVPIHEKKFLDPDQIPTFINAVHDTPVEIPALLALSSLRRSEILSLTWENIDLKKRIIKIRGASVLDKEGNLVDRKQNKTNGSTRNVEIFISELYDALKAARKPTGKVVNCNPNTIYSQINRICRKNDLPEIGVHGLRHSFASLAYYLGIPALATMEIGGWSDKMTMIQRYTHLSQSHSNYSSEKLREFFEKEKNNIS